MDHFASISFLHLSVNPSSVGQFPVWDSGVNESFVLFRGGYHQCSQRIVQLCAIDDSCTKYFIVTTIFFITLVGLLVTFWRDFRTGFSYICTCAWFARLGTTPNVCQNTTFSRPVITLLWLNIHACCGLPIVRSTSFSKFGILCEFSWGISMIGQKIQQYPTACTQLVNFDAKSCSFCFDKLPKTQLPFEQC